MSLRAGGRSWLHFIEQKTEARGAPDKAGTQQADSGLLPVAMLVLTRLGHESNPVKGHD